MPEATADALMGLGMPPQLSALIGANALLQNGTGTTTTGASILHSKNTELNPQTGATAYTFPSTVGVMEPYFVINSQTTTAVIGVPVGHTLTTASSGSTTGLNGIISIVTLKSAIIWQYKPKFWCFLLTA